MTRLKIGVVGAGLIAQVEHIPNLLRLSRKFDLVGVADPSARARTFVAEHFGVAVFEDSDALLDTGLDALLVSAPDPLHKSLVLKGLSEKLHVFCEKPLCYAATDAEVIREARDRAGRVVQVGYMKRFDPSYEAALELLPEDGGGLRYISVEVSGTDAKPFIAHHPHALGDTLPAAVIAEGRELQRQQVKEAVGQDLTGGALRGFVDAFCSSMVHDVNAVHGLLERMGITDENVVSGQIFADGDGASGAISLQEGRTVWQIAHLRVPSLDHYRERISLYFDDLLLELAFPSPYLYSTPTRLEVYRSHRGRLEKTLVRDGFEESFVREVEGFWSAIVEGAPVRNTVEQAARDQRLLCELTRAALRTYIEREGAPR